ncbi:hypothetical protein BGZ60DRAFT_568489 [Tricladium varicosporioides]|nr:hypothetical protein BGZ60DRAFT_568489 [Hymenoscyphus varicosporioides]
MEFEFESESSKRLTRFPGSGPNPLLSPTTPASPKGTYSKNDSGTERLTTQKSRKLQSELYGLPDKHPARYSSQNSSRVSLGSPSPGKRDSGPTYKDGNEATGSRTKTEERPPSPMMYHEFMVLDQAGLANIGCDSTRECNLVAIKRFNGIRKSPMRRIRPFTSDYVVSIQETYFENANLVIIYERMDVSLRHVTGILQGPFKPPQIAVICKQLVAGLSYIHEELSLSHGELTCGTILLNLDGMVKIANIGESFIRNRYTTAESRRNDSRSIGFVMMELMEPTTYILNPHSAELRSPEKWKDGSGIQSFLSATQHQSLEQLRNHDFLPKEPLSKCLKAHVLCALIAAGTHWDILSLP